MAQLVNFKISGTFSVPDDVEPVRDRNGNVIALKKDGVEVRLIAGIEVEGNGTYQALCCEDAMGAEGFMLIDYDESETVFEEV